MTVSETETSRRTSRDHPDYEGRFSCTLRCSNLPCVEPVAVVGNVYSDEQVDDGEGGWEWEEYMVPVFVHPVPDLFSVVPQCPKDIATEIRRAFSLFWCDLRASANRIRAALELILDHFGIPRRHKVKGGLRHLSLHQRLQFFEKREPTLAKPLLALKWLGNLGSHRGELRKDDLFDAFDLLEHVHEELFAQRTKQITQLAKEINKRRGPRSAVRRREGARRP